MFISEVYLCKSEGYVGIEEDFTLGEAFHTGTLETLNSVKTLLLYLQNKKNARASYEN